MFKKIKYHRVRLVRNGAFVGLYRPPTESCRYWKLWRSINSEDYGKHSALESYDGEPHCNETYRIPKIIRLSKENLERLDGMLGVGKHRVMERIRKFAENEAQKVGVAVWAF